MALHASGMSGPCPDHRACRCPRDSKTRPIAAALLLVSLLLLAGCSSMGTLWNWMGGRVVVTEAELQQRLDRRFPREFEAVGGIAALTLSQPQAQLQDDQLSLAFDLQASVAGLRLPLRGHFAFASGLRFDRGTQALYLEQPRLTRLDLPQVPGAPEHDQLFALADAMLAEYALAEPVYVLSERRQAQVPRGREIYRVDIEDGRIVIGIGR